MEQFPFKNSLEKLQEGLGWPKLLLLKALFHIIIICKKLEFIVQAESCTESYSVTVGGTHFASNTMMS